MTGNSFCIEFGENLVEHKKSGVPHTTIKVYFVRIIKKIDVAESAVGRRLSQIQNAQYSVLCTFRREDKKVKK